MSKHVIAYAAEEESPCEDVGACVIDHTRGHQAFCKRLAVVQSIYEDRCSKRPYLPLGTWSSPFGFQTQLAHPKVSVQVVHVGSWRRRHSL